MSTKSNDHKTEQLGMSIGTASGRLKKSIMLMLLHRLGEDFCLRCGKEIVDPDDLSVDHKQPWLGNDTALFWDLANIGFSHTKCNRPDRPRYGLSKGRQEGTAWCSRCKKYLPVIHFGKDRNRVGGYRTTCNGCRKKLGWDH